MENLNDDVIVEVTGEDGVTHSLRLITLFKAGSLDRQYGAFMTQDILLFRLKDSFVKGNDNFVEEIPTNDFLSVSDKWNDIMSSSALDDKYFFDGTVTLLDSSDEEIQIFGTIYGTFKIDFDIHDYVAICPHNLMFYRVELSELSGSESFTLKEITVHKEYEDVTTAFSELLEKENK